MKHIELRPDRRLLKSNFDGYKLSLDPIPVLRMELTEHNRPHRVRPTEQQFSYYHARLFGMQNHLVRDPWASGQCYYVDASGMVQHVQYDETLGRLKPVSAVFSLPFTAAEPRAPDIEPSAGGGNKTAGTYNCSLVFASEQYCLLSDGRGVIRVLETGDRTSGRTWKACSVFRPAETDARSGFPAGGFTLLDARLLVQDCKKQLHCIVMQVEHHLDRQSETLIYWFTLEQQQEQENPDLKLSSDQEWNLHASRMLRGGGFPRYCSLDYRATGVLLASDKPFRFVFDSERPVDPTVVPKASEPMPEAPQPYEKYPFEWHQTMDEVIIKFCKQGDACYQVATEPAPDGLCVSANGTVVIDGAKLFAKIDGECTVWTMDQKTLEITLQKQVTGVMWPFIFPGGPDEAFTGVTGGSEETSHATDLPPASSLEAPLEDCDFGEAGEVEEYYTLERLSSDSHQATHHISLGSVPPLFSVTLRAGLPAAIALRHDIDACLWQLQPQTGPDACHLQHEGTLHAFGYVQASKRQQKFLACSPDFGYAVICEAERRLYIYKGSYGGADADMRQRSGPQVSLGQQRLVNLDDAGEILGICCEKEVTLLMTETSLITLQLGIEE